MLKEILIISGLLTNMAGSNFNLIDQGQAILDSYIRQNISSVSPGDYEGTIVHEPISLEEVYPGKIEEYEDKGQQLGYEPNTIQFSGYSFDYTDMSGNTGAGDDFQQLNDALNRLELVKVGQRGIETFFGHNNNLSNTGPFAILGHENLLYDGVEVITTDSEGYSRGYYMTQTIEFSHQDQIYQFYGDFYFPDLAYNGNHQDMIYIQHCRWDISFELLVVNIGLRIW